MAPQTEKPWAYAIPPVTELCMKNAAVIIFKGKNKTTTYADGKAVHGEADVYMPFIVHSRDELSHVELMRKQNGYAVVAIEHLDNLAKHNPKEAKIIAAQVHLMTYSPEKEGELADAKSKIAELEAKLAKAQAANVADVEADLKAEAEARAVAEAKIAELEAKLANAGSSPAPEAAKKLEKK